MSSTPAPPSSNGGRFTGFVMTLIVVGCIALIGLAVYIKYELDRAQTALTTPELQFTAEQLAFDKIRRDLGYGGFVGLAQNFVVTHDAAILPDMKAQLKLANESMERLPEKTAAETRHDLQAILATFSNVMKKAEESTAAAPAPEFANADIVPLYATLPILDARVTSALTANHVEQQAQAQFWSTLLMMVSWISLIAASGLAVGIYLVLRDRHSAPLRALTQSVKNMAHGDMRTPIWGMERQDAVGNLARSIDMARFHFSQLPDMSLLSEQGPVRIRFEGNTRSLFEAMMRVISRDSEEVHTQANNLTEAVNKQQEALALVTERVEAILQNVEKRAVSGDQQVRQALQGMLGSAESLKNAQEHASDQLNRIIPFLQERSQGMSEIAHITGKQIAQVLQSLTTTEKGLRSSAEQSATAIQKFSSTADTLGERMFGAVNLLQASGKVLAETTETTRSTLEQTIERIGAAGFAPSAPMPAAAASGVPFDSSTAQRLEGAVAALESAHKRLEFLLAEQAEATRTHIDLLTVQNSGLLTQSTTSSHTLSTAADRLRDEQAKLAQMLAGLGAQFANPANASAQTSYDGVISAALTNRLDELGRQITQATSALASLPQEIANQARAEPALASTLLADVKSGFDSITANISVLHGQIATLQAEPRATLDGKPSMVMDEQMRDHWYQMAAQIEATRSSLAQVIMQQTDRVEAHLLKLSKNSSASAPGEISRDTQNQMEQQTLILNELVTTLSLLDAHMQELRSQVQHVG